MKILLTGASGFLGKHILESLNMHKIITVGRSRSDIMMDIAGGQAILPKTDLVIHAAGKAHSIPRNESEAQVFFDVNYKGTVNFLNVLKNSKAIPPMFVFVSSVSVYGLTEGRNVSESHPLLAKDPYGLSKIKAEKFVLDWCKENDVICTILRLPLLIGKEPVGNLAKMIDGIKTGRYFDIGEGSARKSMVRAHDVASVIPVVAHVGGIYNLCDGVHPSFSELSEYIASKLGKKKPASLPLFACRLAALLGDVFGKFPLNSNKLNKINSTLTFDDNKARKAFDWNPTPILNSPDFDADELSGGTRTRFEGNERKQKTSI